MSKQAFPLLSLTVIASATLVAERFVTFEGATPDAGGFALGVVRQAAVSGDRVTVDAMGTVIVEAGAAIVAGSTLKVDATGKVITWATSGARVGIALQAASASGQYIEILLIPSAA